MTIPTLELDKLARTRDAHVAALNANDADGWVACFAPNAVQMPPNDSANVGTAKIHAWSAGMLSAVNAEFALDVDETQLAGEDWAFERGTYTITLSPKAGGEPIRDAGKYITIYSRESDGQWLMARDIWNSNNQLAPQT
jgi:uncharacterized protein (TIGR02246 family)